MIIRSIHVEGWRCFMDAVNIGPFDESLNILHAPNGTGKSTLFEALCRALLDGHKVGGREIEMIRPWGRALSPKVIVEFVHEGIEYRIKKQFLEGAASLLERKENGRFRRLAESSAADEQVRTIITKTAPGRGLAKQENWGLAQVLWAPQGNLALKNLSGSLVADIRTSLGVQISGTGTGPLESRIQELYLQFFTPGGKPKSGRDAPALVRLKEKLQDAKEKCREALEIYQDFEKAAYKVEDLRARRAQARYDAEELTKTLKDVRTRVEEYKKLLAEQEQHRERVKSEQARYNELKQRIDLISSTKKELTNAKEIVKTLDSEQEFKLREMHDREKEAVKAKAVLEDARKGREAVDAAEQEADIARRYLECKKESDRLNKLIGSIEKAQKIFDKQRKERNELVAPDAAALRSIRKAIKDRDEARLRIEASLITLEIVPEKSGTVEVVSGEKTGKQKLTAGSPTRLMGSPEVVVDLKGVARLRASGPTGSIEEHREKRAKAENKLKKLTEPFSTANLDELERLNEKAKELDKNVSEAKMRLSTLLSDKSIEDFAQERARSESVLENIIRRHPNWEKSPPDSDYLKNAAEECKRSFIEKVESTEADWEKANIALTAATGQESAISTRLDETKDRINSLESKLAELIIDGKQDHEREAELKKIILSWDAAKTRLEEIENKIATYEDNPIAVVSKLEKQLEAAGDTATKALEAEKSEEGRLEHLSAEGPYSALTLAEEEVSKLEREIAGEELRVGAVGLLHKTLTKCRTEAVALVARPVEEAATRIFQRIAGGRLGRVQLGETFEPSSVLPEITDISVTLENVSGGEKEQIYLATRLALADVLAKEERQLLVLDDILTATDTGRFARILSVLEEAAEHLQLLILTCHPEKYRGIGNACFFDLEDSLHNSS